MGVETSHQSATGTLTPVSGCQQMTDNVGHWQRVVSICRAGIVLLVQWCARNTPTWLGLFSTRAAWRMLSDCFRMSKERKKSIGTSEAQLRCSYQTGTLRLWNAAGDINRPVTQSEYGLYHSILTSAALSALSPPLPNSERHVYAEGGSWEITALSHWCMIRVVISCHSNRIRILGDNVKCVKFPGKTGKNVTNDSCLCECVCPRWLCGMNFKGTFKSTLIISSPNDSEIKSINLI